jgi:hypothetical protein
MQCLAVRTSRFVLTVMLGVGAVFSFTFCATASASMLPLPAEQSEWSDLVAAGIAGSYDATTDVLAVTAGTASQFDVGPGFAADYTPFNASVRISNLDTLTIDGAGDVTSSGNLEIKLLGAPPAPYTPGEIPNPPYVVGQDLLTGSITDVLFAGTGVLHMQFTVTGGTAAPDFGGVGYKGGIILNMISGTGSTATDFSSSFAFTTSTMDTLGTIPEPSSMLLGGCGAIGLLWLAKRRRSTTLR